jgi:rhamnopyranosyl-N-acetylglucosaminyl-diphospho-decaprenol beta-1,3/1,4-galactofuranosyltransferase
MAVIVAFENPSDLEDALCSALSNSPGEVIVVDNSVDSRNRAANEAIARKLGALYFSNQANLGSAGGFAIGMERASKSGFEWVWLLDQDGLASPDCLEKLLASGEEGILCPVVLSKVGNYELPDFRCRINILGGLVPAEGSGEPSRIILAGTHGILISRGVMETVGFYDGNRFFVGGEDFDYSIRAAKAGFKMWLVPDARVYHPDLSLKSNLSRRAVIMRRAAQKMAAVTPQFLGFLRKNEPSANKGGREFMIRFNRARLNRAQNFLAVVYSVLAVSVLKIIGVEVKFMETLGLYFSHQEGELWEGSQWRC